ncbi:MAG TPA: hypothetical protein VN651_06765 [Gemmatimonadaceae bacterium]|nr:hypothetical protein [Gemmatimonadaceae bacterium]
MKLLIPLLLLPVGALSAQSLPCCSITAINAAAGVVTGKVTSNASTFQFKIANKQTLAGVKVGQAVYANFTTHQVSLDGRSACCTVSSGPTPAIVPRPGAPSTTAASAAAAAAATAAKPGAPAPAQPVTPQGAKSGATPVGGAGPAPRVKVEVISLALPAVGYGPPQPAARPGVSAAAIRLPRFDSRTVKTTFAGKSLTSNIVHLRGLDGIEQAPGIPDGARRLLEMHVRKLQPGEPDHYILNLDLAKQWLATHPVPDDIQPIAQDANTHSGCHSFSMHCAEESAEHAADQAQKLIDQATDSWNHASNELSKQWNTVESCFADNTLPLPDVPVKFTTSPGMTIDLSRSTSDGATSTQVQGSLGLSFPMQSDFQARLDLFYIPCLPFVVRPKQLGADGSIMIGEDLKVSASASGKFNKTFTIPPTGGPRIPIEVIPIVIAGVPVAEMDVSAYVEGNVAVSAEGTVAGKFEVNNPHKAEFGFACSGHGCSGSSHGLPDPTTATESASIKGTLSVRPDIFTAVQLDFDVDALSARAGPQPYLLGQAAGCVAGAAAQSTSGVSSSSENHALVADLDWGVDLRAEALIAGKVVGDKYQHSFTANKHLWFRDLAPGGSTALDVLVTPVGDAIANKPATYKMRMPTCYPYSGAVHYQVAWTGGGAPAPNPSCKWQANAGTCDFDSGKDLLISINWGTAGSRTLNVLAVGDKHDDALRTFSPAPKTTQVEVTVKPAG